MRVGKTLVHRSCVSDVYDVAKGDIRLTGRLQVVE
jgi:hypothetical protein